MEPEPEPQQVTDLVRFNAYNSAFIVTQQGIVYPFELIKTRVQIATAHGGSELAAMRTVARGVIADRGVVRGNRHAWARVRRVGSRGRAAASRTSAAVGSRGRESWTAG